MIVELFIWVKWFDCFSSVYLSSMHTQLLISFSVIFVICWIFSPFSCKYWTSFLFATHFSVSVCTAARLQIHQVYRPHHTLTSQVSDTNTRKQPQTHASKQLLKHNVTHRNATQSSAMCFINWIFNLYEEASLSERLLQTNLLSRFPNLIRLIYDLIYLLLYISHPVRPDCPHGNSGQRQNLLEHF